MVVERPLGSTGLGSEQIPQFRVGGETAGRENAPLPFGGRMGLAEARQASAANPALSFNRL